jgi:hypothetical protein
VFFDFEQKERKYTIYKPKNSPMTTIDDVLKHLDEIIVWSEQHQSPMGYFAALYQRMTMAVKDGILQNKFDNGPRMEKLDIIFAKRYFEAFDNYQKNKPITKSWEIALNATKTDQITVIQHLLLGINAHINLDLGIAASDISTKSDIQNLEKDFKQINTIIAGLIDDTKLRLSKIWLPFRIFTKLLDTESDGIINFSIKVARTFSWENAKQLTFIEPFKKPDLIIGIDKNVEFLGNRIAKPSTFTKSILWLMRLGESGYVAEKIKILK